MIRHPYAVLMGATTFALLTPSAVFAQGVSQTPNNSVTVSSDSSHDVSQTGDSSRSVRYFHRKTRKVVSRSAPARSLPSRGGSAGTSAPAAIVGRLAIVTADNAQIHAGRERYNRLLSVVPKGQNIAVSGETDAEYAVVMIDHSTGFISKKDVQILDYQVVNNTPAQTSPTQQTPATSGADMLGQQMVQTATGYLGVPYVWGGNTRNGIDCSGFVKAVYSTYGISLPRVAIDQATVGYDVPRSDYSQWVAGDRMYFACHHPQIDHTGMYIGNGYFIHASVGHSNQVAIDRVDNAYYGSHLVAVRRSKELLGETPSPITQQASAASSDGDHEASQQ